MERIPRGIYSQEFRGEAVRLHEMDGLTVPEVAKRLSLPQGTLKNWVYAARKGKLREVGKGQSAHSTETGHAFHGKLDSRSVVTRGFFFTPDLRV